MKLSEIKSLTISPRSYGAKYILEKERLESFLEETGCGLKCELIKRYISDFSDNFPVLFIHEPMTVISFMVGISFDNECVIEQVKAGAMAQESKDLVDWMIKNIKKRLTF